MTVAAGGAAALLAHQAPNGAFPAGPTFSQYPHAWLRDGTFVAYALDRAGEHGAARRFYRWVAGTVARLEGRVDDLVARRGRGEPIPEALFLPTRFALGGDPLGDDWPNFQLDGYGQWLWGLGEHLALTGEPGLPEEFADGVRVTLRYLAHFWNEPCYDCWEEFPYRWHTSTLASLFGGLRAMGRFFPEAARLAGDVRTFLLAHAVEDGALVKFVGFPQADASLLWAAVPFGAVDVRDPVFAETLARVERDLWRGGLHRYANDTYYGGGSWVLLTAWLGWVYARLGRAEDARRVRDWVRARDDGRGLPEQTPEGLLHPPYLDYWRDRWGESARPLLWSHAMLLVLEAELSALPDSREAPRP